MAEVAPDTMVNIVHAIYPRAGANGKMAKNMAVRLVQGRGRHAEARERERLPRVPVRGAAHVQDPRSHYAVGPMFDALPDVRQLNQLKRMDLAGADIAISGMWIAKDDGVLNPRTIKVGPRKVIVANDTESMKPLLSGANWQLADVRIAQLQASIRKMLMADQLSAQDGPAMTATEIHARIALIRQILGPMFGRMQAEYLTHDDRAVLRDRVRGRHLPAAASTSWPATSRSSTSARWRARRTSRTSPRFRTRCLHPDRSQPFMPTVLDNYDLDAMSRVLAEAQGVPQKCLRDMDKVMQLRDRQRAQQQAQAQQQAAEPEPAVDGCRRRLQGRARPRHRAACATSGEPTMPANVQGTFATGSNPVSGNSERRAARCPPA
jgi:hypothetical protein